MKFIELHHSPNDEWVHIRVDSIVSIRQTTALDRQHEGKDARSCVGLTNGSFYYVTATVEDVLAAIGEWELPFPSAP